MVKRRSTQWTVLLIRATQHTAHMLRSSETHIHTLMNNLTGTHPFLLKTDVTEITVTRTSACPARYSVEDTEE